MTVGKVDNCREDGMGNMFRTGIMFTCKIVYKKKSDCR